MIKDLKPDPDVARRAMLNKPHSPDANLERLSRGTIDLLGWSVNVTPKNTLERLWCNSCQTSETRT